MEASRPSLGPWLQLWSARAGQDYRSVAKALSMEESGLNRWWNGKRNPRKADVARLTLYFWQLGAITQPGEVLQALADVGLTLPAFIDVVTDLDPIEPGRHQDFLVWLEGRSRSISLEHQRVWRQPIYVERPVETAAIRDALLGGVAPVALWGMGGVGKTALAMAVAELPEVRARFWSGTLWAAPGPRSEWGSWLERWRRLLKVAAPADADEADLHRIIRDYLAAPGRRFLIVIDDTWEFVALAPLLPAGGANRLLVTTRDRNLAATVPGAALIQVGPMGEEQALALLRGQAGPARAGDEPPEVAAELVRLVEGLPLAVTLLARLVSLKGWQRVAAEARDAYRRLPSLRTDAGNTRENSVRVALSLSYAALDGESQRRFRQLAVFPSGGSIWAATAAGVWGLASPGIEPAEVLADAEASLEFLFGRGLLLRSGAIDDRPEYFRLHAVVHDYASFVLRAAERDEQAAARLRFAQTYVDWSYSLTAASSVQPDAVALELPNLAQAFDYAFDASSFGKCSYLLSFSHSSLLAGLNFSTLDGWLARLADHAQELSPEALGLFEHVRARRLYAGHRWDEAREHLQAALANQALEPRLKAFMCFEEMAACLPCGDLPGAEQMLDEGRRHASLSQAADVRLALAKAGAALAESRGDWAGAVDLLEEAAGLARTMEEPGELADAYCRAGVIFRRTGNLEPAEKFLTLALDMAEATRLPLIQLNALVELAPLHVDLNQPEAAANDARRLLALLDRIAMSSVELAGRRSFAHQIIAASATAAGKLDDALAEARKAVQLAEEAHDPDAQGDAYEVQARVHAAREEIAEALAASEKATRLCRAVGATGRAGELEWLRRQVQGFGPYAAPGCGG